MIIVNFTPWSALAGGILIGSAAVLLMAFNGRTAGVSGVLAGLVATNPGPQSGDIAWRFAFLLGLIIGARIFTLVGPVSIELDASWPVLIAGGLLVGFGTCMGGGCTSGHGVCGVARLSQRSLAATGIFVLTAFVTVFIVRHIMGIQP